MKNKWKIILGALAAVIVLTFIFIESTKPLEANLKQIQPSSIANTFKEEGKVVPLEEHPVFAELMGTITNLAVEEGQQVRKGQLLAVLDSREIDYQARIQELQIEQARRNLEAAEVDFGRIEQLYDAGAVTQKEYEDMKNMVETARNHLELQKQQLALLHFPRDKFTIVSPGNGIVANLAVKQGAVTNPQTPLMSILKVDSYEVEVFILTSHMPSIQIDMPVKLVQDRKDGEVVFPGTIKKIAPSAVETVSALGLTEQRVKVTIQPDIPEGVNLLPGFNLDVEFTLDQRDNVLVVPKSALFPYNNGNAIWIVRDGKAAVQPVTTGFEHNRDVVIDSGLNLGDLVILNPQLDGLKEGKKISVRQ